MGIYDDHPGQRVDKPNHGRRVPKKAKRGEFSPKVRNLIIERDKGLCVRCGDRYAHIHHIIFRSANGKGTIDNGVCVCRLCHDAAHTHVKARKWFEDYRERVLLQRGIEDETRI